MASATVPAAGVGPTAPVRRNWARIAEQTWIWTIVGYSLLRFFIAGAAFSEHGANIWIFGLVDVGTAWPYGKSVAVVCKRAARSEWKRLPIPLVVAIVTFFAPYAYLWFGAGEMPGGVRIGMVICVSILLVAASTGVLAKTRKLRREAQDDVAMAATDSDLGADLVGPAGTEARLIDLRGDQVDRPGVVIDLSADVSVVERTTS